MTCFPRLPSSAAVVRVWRQVPATPTDPPHSDVRLGFGRYLRPSEAIAQGLAAPSGPAPPGDLGTELLAADASSSRWPGMGTSPPAADPGLDSRCRKRRLRPFRRPIRHPLRPGRRRTRGAGCGLRCDFGPAEFRGYCDDGWERSRPLPCTSQHRCEQPGVSMQRVLAGRAGCWASGGLRAVPHDCRRPTNMPHRLASPEHRNAVPLALPLVKSCRARRAWREVPSGQEKYGGTRMRQRA